MKLMHSLISMLISVACRNITTVDRYGIDTAVPTVQQVVIAGSPHQSAHLPFDWEVYTDPSRPEFWADGADGILPRPFLHLASKPTKENARKLLAWQQLQWQTIEQIIKALGGADELDAYTDLIGENILKHISRKDNLLPTSDVPQHNRNEILPNFDWQQVGIVYIYRSDCPVCQRQTHVIEAVKTLGARVVALQLDRGQPLHANSQPYRNGDWQAFFPLTENMSTPTFYIAIKGQAARRHVGYISLRDLTRQIKKLGGDEHES